MTTCSRRFEAREGPQTIDIEMRPGPALVGVVKRPDGSALSGANVFVSATACPATIQDGKLSSTFSSPEIAGRTGPDGRFELPMPLEPYVVGVLHDFGGAEISAANLASHRQIVVQPWARVEGVVQAPRPETDSDVKEDVTLTVNQPEDVCRLLEPSNMPCIEWRYSADLTSSRRFVFERVLPGRAEIESSAAISVRVAGKTVSTVAGWFCVAGESTSGWRVQKFPTLPGKTAHIEFANRGRPVAGRVVLPAGGWKKEMPVGGWGLLVFQRPLVPLPPEIAKQPAKARKQWEKQWFESEAGLAADRAAQDRPFVVAADGRFETDGAAPGVYKLAVELHRAGKAADEPGDEVAWLVQEVTIPADAADKPFDLGNYTATAYNLVRGDVGTNFQFQAANGRWHRLSEYRGKKVVLRFTIDGPQWMIVALAWMPLG